MYDQNPKICVERQAPHFSDFNGDGYTDLLCFDRGYISGHIWIWFVMDIVKISIMGGQGGFGNVPKQCLLVRTIIVK